MAWNKATLIGRLVNLKYTDVRCVTKQLRDFQGLVNRLNTMKMVPDDELQVFLTLEFVARHLGYIVGNIEQLCTPREISAWTW